MNSIQASVVTIDVDPHPKTHTAAALDENGKVIESLTISNSTRGLHTLRRWARGFQKRRWAVEGIGNHHIYPFVESLLEQGEQVYAISPNLTSQYLKPEETQNSTPGPKNFSNNLREVSGSRLRIA
jgi:hypothetical protein